MDFKIHIIMLLDMHLKPEKVAFKFSLFVKPPPLGSRVNNFKHQLLVEEEIASFKTSVKNLNTPYLIDFELKPH